MNELELTKMLFVYEQTVGAFESENVLDLFMYYGEAVNETGFYNWLKEIDLEKEWLKYRRERGIDEYYDKFEK
nr:hypothetical protein [Clostridium paraputrificum]